MSEGLSRGNRVSLIAVTAVAGTQSCGDCAGPLLELVQPLTAVTAVPPAAS